MKKFNLFFLLIYTLIISQHPALINKDYVLKNSFFPTMGRTESMGSRQIKIPDEVHPLSEVKQFLKDTSDYEESLQRLETDPLFVLKVYFHKNLDSYEGRLPNILEGMSLRSSMTAFMDDMLAYIEEKHPQDKLLQELAFTFAHAYIIEDTLYNISDEYLISTDKKPMNEYVKVVISHVKNTIRNAKPNGVPILIPGGMNRFISEGGGHAFMYVVSVYLDDNNQRKIRFELINRGYGLKNHLKDVGDDGKPVFQSFIIDNIDPEVIEEGILLDQLLSLKVFYERNEPLLPIVSYYIEKFSWSSGHAIDRIYKLCKQELVEKGHGSLYVVEDNRYWHHEQRWGTCTMKVLMTWMRENIHPDMMREFKYFVAERSTKKLKEKFENPEFQKDAVQVFQAASNFEMVIHSVKDNNFLPVFIGEGEFIKNKRAKKYSPRGIYKPGVL